MSQKKICFVGLDNYPVLNPEKGDEYFGGESVQQTLLAKAFRDTGYDVSMVVKDHGQAQGEVLDSIKVWKTFKEHEGLPVFRFVYPKMTSILTALKKADGDIYYQSCAGVTTGFVAWFCQKYHRKFIFRVASDSDCIPGQQLIKLWRDRKLFEYGLRRADVIAAQGKNQVELLHKHYGLKSVFVNMAVELPEENNHEQNIDILWVNNIRDCKRPFMVLQLAEMLPEYRLVVVGGAVKGYEALYNKVKDKSRQLNNIEFMGAIPYHQVNQYFSRTKLFLNTSDIEGFPNSFLQAWIRGVPVVSFFDPDGLIASRQLGAAPTDIDAMANDLKRLLSDDTTRQDIAEQAQKYVLENYSPINVARHYESLLTA